MKCRGINFRDEDDAYEYFRQIEVDDEAEAEREAEAKRRASGHSPELLRIQNAREDGARAGGMDLAPSLNPHPDNTPEHDAWEDGRFRALTVRSARMVA